MTPQPQTFRRRPTTVEAMQWTGDNADALAEWTRGAFCQPIGQAPAGEVWDLLHLAWIPLQVGDWVVRGSRGEHWPVRADVFAETYEPAVGARQSEDVGG